MNRPTREETDHLRDLLFESERRARHASKIEDGRIRGDLAAAWQDVGLADKAYKDYVDYLRAHGRDIADEQVEDLQEIAQEAAVHDAFVVDASGLRSAAYADDPSDDRHMSQKLRGGPVRKRNPIIAQHLSPLTYQHASLVMRMAVLQPDVGAPARPYRYFQDTYDTISKGPTGRALKTPKKQLVPGADDDVVAFLDYHTVPVHGAPDAVFIDFIATRGDQRRKGHAAELVKRLYDLYEGASWIDWGRVSEGAEVLWRRYQALASKGLAPRTYGKLW